MKAAYQQLRANRASKQATLNDKIDKVITEIKQLNREKASTFGIPLGQLGGGPSFNEQFLFDKRSERQQMKSTSTAELGAKRSDWEEDTFDIDRRYEDILVAKGSVLAKGQAKSIADESFTASQLQPAPTVGEPTPAVDVEAIVREKAEVERRLAEEQERVAALTEQLQGAARRLEEEREELIAQVAEVHQAEADRRELELKRMSQRNAKLTRQLVREQAIVSDHL